MSYKKCSRCSLNYIKDFETLCRVCMEDLGKTSRTNADEAEEYDICPECGENVIKSGEDMCQQCALERVKDGIEEPVKKTDEWSGLVTGIEVEDAFTEDLGEQVEELDDVEIDQTSQVDDRIIIEEEDDDDEEEELD